MRRILLLFVCFLKIGVSKIFLENPCCREFDTFISFFGKQLNSTESVSGNASFAGTFPYNTADTLGCSDYADPTRFSNKIAIVERGSCTFVEKVYYAQRAGAIAVIVYDRDFNVSIFGMRGSNIPETDQVVIPSFFLSRSDAFYMRAISINQQQNNESESIFLTINGTFIKTGFDINDFLLFGHLLGIFVAISTPYWIIYFILRIRKKNATKFNMKKLKKQKYEASVVAQIPAPEIMVAVTSENEHADGSSATTTPIKKEVEDVIEVQENEPFDLEQQKETSEEPETIEEKQEPKTNQEGEYKHKSSSDNPLFVRPTGMSEKDVETSSAKIEETVIAETNKKKKKKRFFNRRKNNDSDTATTSQNLYDNGTCSICLEEFETNVDILILPCRHIFHDTCVRGWLEDHGNCPFCKTNISGEKPSQSQERLREFLAQCFGGTILQTLVMWFLCICFAMAISYFLFVGLT